MFFCPQCGSADVVWGRYVHRVADHSAVLACICGAGEDGVAAILHDRRPTLVREWGALASDGDWVAAHAEAVVGADADPPRAEVFCPACVTAAEPGDWRTRPGTVSVDGFGQTPFLACHACGTEYSIV